jgi:hypothetical protein
MLNKLLGAIFYLETINYDRYVRLIVTGFFVQLTEWERSYMLFQQDSAAAQKADNTLAA